MEKNGKEIGMKMLEERMISGQRGLGRNVGRAESGTIGCLCEDEPRRRGLRCKDDMYL